MNSIMEVMLSFYPGETVLVEYTSDSSPELLFYILLKSGKEVLVDDIADTFPEFYERLVAMGVDPEDIRGVKTIKIGGVREYGDVLGRVDLDKYALDFRYYSYVFSKIKGDFFLNPVLGMHKLLSLTTKEEAMRIVKNITSFVGNRRRIAYYFINVDSLEANQQEIVALLREVSTSIVRWARRKNLTLEVVKSANVGLEGISIEITPLEILGAPRRASQP
ncbi:DUF257 family protein [Pyrococcus yayanosii]|uniref:DUF257 family protein n=1 Tax=Pyrococcus yayanosii TaxID=1008460 RepID=UPI00130544C4|nr:DUF257 family protein [Pyrococcus yayanosii]